MTEPAELPEDGRERIEKAISNVLSTGGPALTSVAETIRKGESAMSPAELEVLRGLYPGLEKFVHAVHQGLFLRPLWKNPQEINKVVRDLASAGEAFDRARHAQLANLAKSLQGWATAFMELQELKVSDFDVKRRRAMAVLVDAGDYASQVGQTMMLLEPFLFMMAGEKAYEKRDAVTSGALMEQAAQAAAQAGADLAGSLSESEGGEHKGVRNTYEGMVKLYGAINTFTRARTLFERFDFDALADEDLVAEAREARDLMAKGIQEGDFRTLSNYSEALYHLLESTNRFAKLIQAVFHSVYTGNPKALRELKHNIREARKAVVKAGLDYKSIVEYCDVLSLQVNNLERLASPSGKDFGKYSGLVAAAVFLPFVLVLSWANGQFGLNLNPTAILEYSLLFGLVAGFGLAALKFTPKGLIKLPFVGEAGQSEKGNETESGR